MSNQDGPSAQIIEAKEAGQVIMDGKGRKLLFRPLTILEQSKLMRAVGSDNSMNQGFFSIASIAVSIREIDETPMAFPTTLPQVEAAIARMADEGFEAIVATKTAEVEAGQNDIADAKN